MSHSRDTSDAAARVQREVFRRMGPAGRLRAAVEMSEFLRTEVESGIRARHPDWDDRDVRGEMLRLFYGEKLAEAVMAAPWLS